MNSTTDQCRHCHGYRHAMPIKTSAGVVHMALCKCDRLKCSYCEQPIGPTASACKTCGAPLPAWPSTRK